MSCTHMSIFIMFIKNILYFCVNNHYVILHKFKISTMPLFTALNTLLTALYFGWFETKINFPNGFHRMIIENSTLLQYCILYVQ